MANFKALKFIPGVVAAFTVCLAACSESGLSGDGSGAPALGQKKDKDEAGKTSEPLDDETASADQPTQVSGAFLVCGKDSDPRDPALPSDGDPKGCAVIDGVTLKRKVCQSHEQVKVTYADKTGGDVVTSLAPATSFWHFRFMAAAGKQLATVSSLSTCDGAPTEISARDVAYTPAKAADGAPDLGASVSGAQDPSNKPAPAGDSPAEEGSIELEKPKPPHIIFVTSHKFTGILGTRAGANQLCDEAAAAGGLAGEYIALVSGIDGSISGKFTNDRPVVNTNNETVAEAGALWSGRLLAPVRYDEFRSQVTDAVWSASDASGKYYEYIPLGDPTYASCRSWISADSAVDGGIGDPNATDASWIDSNSGRTCDQRAHIYCISE